MKHTTSKHNQEQSEGSSTTDKNRWRPKVHHLEPGTLTAEEKVP